MNRVIATALLLLLFVYGLAYIGMLKGHTEENWVVGRSFVWGPVPVYRFDNDVAKIVFAPAHAVDRMVRPDEWWTHTCDL